MKQINLDSEEYLLVEVPEDAKEFWISSHYLSTNTHPWTVGERLACKIDETTPLHFINLPNGNWYRLGRVSDLSEEWWSKIVECAIIKGDFGEPWNWFKNYTNEKNPCEFATESGHSLIESYGMKPQGTLILKKEMI